MKSSYDIIKHIMMTEKCTLLKGANQYSFKVCSCATKTEIAAAVESVNIMNYTGKLKRVGRNPVRGRRSNWKKAIVTLAEGTIELA